MKRKIKMHDVAETGWRGGWGRRPTLGRGAEQESLGANPK